MKTFLGFASIIACSWLLNVKVEAQITLGSWPMDEGIDRICHDVSANQKHGVLGDYDPSNGDGDTPPSWIDGVQGKALHFDGVDDYVRVPISPVFNMGSGDFSAEAWIRTTAISGDIVSRYSGSNALWRLMLSAENEGTAIFVLRDVNGNWTDAKTSAPVNDGQWHHLAGVRDGNLLILYVDGAQSGIVDASSIGNVDTSYYLMIGAAFDGRANNLEGDIDAAAVYSGALSPAEVAAHAGVPVGPFIDQDGDGYPRLTTGRGPIDLDDSDAAIHPGAAEICNLKDDDCNGVIDDNCPDLLGVWSMDEGFGGVANDATIHQMDAIAGDYDPTNADGDSPPQWTTGKIGSALLFDGVDDYLRVHNSTQFNVGVGDMSVEAWVKTNASSGTIVSRFSGSSANWSLALKSDGSGKAHFHIRDTNNVSATAESSLIINDGNWHHLAGVRGSGVLSLYVDGLLRGTCDASMIGDIDTHYYVTVGASIDGRAFYLNGIVDEVRLFKRALAAQEVLEHAQPNRPPIAILGSDQSVNESTLVTLDASSSYDPDEDPLTYQWKQLAGTLVTINTLDPVHPTFIAPSVCVGGETLTFQLVVNDGNGDSDPAQVSVTVKNVNNPPVANAGDEQTVHENLLVTLSGSSSYDLDNELLAFSWEQTGGPPVILVPSPTDVTPSFIAPAVGVIGAELTFELTVSDGIDTGVDTTRVCVVNVNQPPLVDAGTDQTKDEARTVQLWGSATDPDEDPLSFQWSQLSGIPVVLSDPQALNSSFSAPVLSAGQETLTFLLEAFDGEYTSSDTVSVMVLDSNAPPACDQARPSKTELWPPNHKLVPITITNVTDPEGAPVQIEILGVTQDEPTNSQGDGDTAPDAIVMDSTVLLRAERSGGGNGRVYQIQFLARDELGQFAVGSVNVVVPLRKKHGATPIDDGQNYVSTQ